MKLHGLSGALWQTKKIQELSPPPLAPPGTAFFKNGLPAPAPHLDTIKNAYIQSGELWIITGTGNPVTPLKTISAAQAKHPPPEYLAQQILMGYLSAHPKFDALSLIDWKAFYASYPTLIATFPGGFFKALPTNISDSVFKQLHPELYPANQSAFGLIRDSLETVAAIPVAMAIAPSALVTGNSNLTTNVVSSLTAKTVDAQFVAQTGGFIDAVAAVVAGAALLSPAAGSGAALPAGTDTSGALLASGGGGGVATGDTLTVSLGTGAGTGGGGLTLQQAAGYVTAAQQAKQQASNITKLLSPPSTAQAVVAGNPLAATPAPAPSSSNTILLVGLALAAKLLLFS